MADFTLDAEAFAPISIRYEGLDAANHTLELGQLGESIQGFARTIAVVANFAYTGLPALHYDALDVKVLAVPVPEHHCFEIWAKIEPIVMTKEFWAAAAGSLGTLMGAVLTYILSSRKAEEMKYLSEALQKSMDGNQAVTEKLVSTVEKLADALNPAVRKALTPIDRSCSQIDIFQGQTKIQSMNSETKRAFASVGTKVADHSSTYKGLITEFNITTGACQVQLEGSDKTINGKISDPAYTQANNPYALALASKTPIGFLAKYEVDAAGELVKLHIFDTTEL